LKPGAKVTGYAFTQFGGTVHWDHLAMSSRVDPAKDPQWSWKVWAEKNQGKRVAELPNDLQTLVRGKKQPEWPEKDVTRLKEWWFENEYQGAREIVDGHRAEKLALEAKKKVLDDVIPATFVMADLPQPRDAFVMDRGQYDKPKDKVTRGTPAIFPALPKQDQYTRLDLAKWLVSPQHPLTARVQANRLWQQFFGVGLVKTSNDFGSQGEPPSHPELLDWLAVTFRDGGWDVKQMMKLIVTSHTYRQQSHLTSLLRERDLDNRLLARGPRQRLLAEFVRDQALAASGLLVAKLGGPSVRPYHPPGLYEQVTAGSGYNVYVAGSGDDLYRRSLYTYWKRSVPHPAMLLFDAPFRETCSLRRPRSNTPLQALNLMNDPTYVEAARNLAQRMMLEGGETTEGRLTYGVRLLLSRTPRTSELAVLRAAFDRARGDFENDEPAAKSLLTVGSTAANATLNPTDLAAFTTVASILLNLDEAIYKE